MTAAMGREVGSTPRVTIGLPVYNGERYVAEAIASLLGQSFSELELVVADNASTDRTLAICRELAAGDARVRVLTSRQNHGAAWNFNRCLKAARGEYFKWAAHDDLYDPRFLDACIRVLDADSGVALCYTQAMEIDAEGNQLFPRGPVNVADLPSAGERHRAVMFDEIYCYAIFGVMRTSTLRRTAVSSPTAHRTGRCSLSSPSMVVWSNWPSPTSSIGSMESGRCTPTATTGRAWRGSIPDWTRDGRCRSGASAAATPPGCGGPAERGRGRAVRVG